MKLPRPRAALVITLFMAAALAGCLTPPTGPPQTTSQAEVAVNSAAWSYEYPGGLTHSVRGTYYLQVAVTVTNRGSVPLAVLAAEFSIFWQNETAGIPAIAATLSTSTVMNGQSASSTIAFLATELRVPVRVEFRQAGFVNTVSANVPAPQPPPIEVTFTGVSAAFSANGTANQSASSGSVFLWVNFTMMNHWRASMALSTVYFKVEDGSGTKFSAEGVMGPASVASGASAAASVLFEVDEGFEPQTMKFDAVLGPWTQVAVPRPV